MESRLRVSGQVATENEFGMAELQQVAAAHLVDDVSVFDPKRRGRALRLSGLLDQVGVKPTAKWLTLHAAKDDFHASVPLDVVRDRAVIIFELDGQPLPESAGGPFRFLIADYAACHTAETDDCANVKFVDRIELTAQRGLDNRPQDDVEHAKLHGH